MAMELVIYVTRQFGIKEYFSGRGGFSEAESSWGIFYEVRSPWFFKEKSEHT